MEILLDLGLRIEDMGCPAGEIRAYQMAVVCAQKHDQLKKLLKVIDAFSVDDISQKVTGE
jgi:hypothetical protein